MGIIPINATSTHSIKQQQQQKQKKPNERSLVCQWLLLLSPNLYNKTPSHFLTTSTLHA